nr:MAG TPA: hypothetical protein [Microviridae sp.]
MHLLLLFFRLFSGSCRLVRLHSLFRKIITTPPNRVRVVLLLLWILQQFFNLKHLSNGKCF